jgi:hypothetical protein
MIDGLLTGIIFATSLVASLFFIKFWRITRDTLFLSFAISFSIEGLTRLMALLVLVPGESTPVFYVARMFAYLIIVAAIVRKNRKRTS